MRWLALFCLILWAVPIQGVEVVLVLTDGMSLEDWLGGGPQLQRLLKEGSLGLMNTRTAGVLNPENTHLTVGAGSRALASTGGALNFQTGETIEGVEAGVIFARRTGVQPPENGAVALEIVNIWMVNEDLYHTVNIGALGSTLGQAGLRVGLIGHSDLPEEPQRYGALLAMDNQGRVPYAWFTGLDLFDRSAPWGVRRDPLALSRVLWEIWGEVDFLVVEWGDGLRLERYRPFLSESRWQVYRRMNMLQFDRFLEGLLSGVNPSETLVILASLTPPGWAQEESKLLTPILLWGRGWRGGSLTSPTTRRRGVVTNLDIAPTILDQFNLPLPAHVHGRGMEMAPALSLEELLRQQERMALVYQFRPPVMRAFVAVEILVFALALLLIILRAIRQDRWQRGVRLALLILLTLPLVFLLLPLFPLSSLGQTIFFTAVLASALAILIQQTPGEAGPLEAVCLLTMGVLVLDTLGGAWLIRRSILGYDPMAGARYYGIGNEFVGILLGSSLIGATAILDRLRLGSHLAVGLLWAGVTAVVALPAFGANVGGAITGVVAFSVTWYRLRRGRFEVAALWPLGLVLAGALTFLVLFDLLILGGGSSHLGRAVQEIQTEGVGVLFQTIGRKFSMNYRLLQYSFWSKGLLGAMATLAFLLYRPISWLDEILKHRPALATGVWGSVVASFVALAVNDSGVVAAATLSLYPTATLLYLAVGSMREMTRV